MTRSILSILSLFFLSFVAEAQMVPSLDENLPHIVTFGKDGGAVLGDDDHKQAFYFVIPASFIKSFYIRVFDPGVGGAIDEKFGDFNTRTTFTVFGGNSIYSGIKEGNAADYSESYVGDELGSEEFGNEKEYDSSWYSFGPYSNKEGEYVPSLDAYLVKIVAEGISGNDGNLYNYFLSSSRTANIAINGGNAFTYEFTVRLNENESSISHLYPFIDDEVVSITLHTFDFDSKVHVSIFSVEKMAEKAIVSGNGNWSKSVHKIKDRERESCLDVRISNGIHNNNGVIYMTNQYNEHVPFMAAPIGDFNFRKTFEIK